MNLAVTCSVLGDQPWSNIHPLNVMMRKGNITMTSEHEEKVRLAMGAFECEYNENGGGGVNLDFFIEDLSEFSNEDIAAPINVCDHDCPSQRLQSNDGRVATIEPENTGNGTTPTSHMASSYASDLLHKSALNSESALLNKEFQDSSPSCSLLCQDESAGFEWLDSLGEDTLIGCASTVGMDESFLLSNAEPFAQYDGMRKHCGYEDDVIEMKVMDIEQNSMNATASGLECEQDIHGGKTWSTHTMNGQLKSYKNATSFMSPATCRARSARSKRARSSGWSSSRILCHRWLESTSPTDSLNSTSQVLTPAGPQYSNNHSHSVMYNQEGDHSTAYHGNMEINFSSRLISNQTGDTPLRDSSKSSKFGSNEQWPKEEDNTREDSDVSNHGGGRRCTHCLSQKTPQWRAGPEGPKTLCNACGVRYKSGRLFDEYRPARSPTFLSYKHSNSHKKVMEMRRRKACHEYNQQYQPYHVRAASLAKDADVGNQNFISKCKVKLSNPAQYTKDFPSINFSDVTLISTRNGLESPSSFLY